MNKVLVLLVLTALSLTACGGGENNAQSGSGTFSIDITGAFEVQLNQGSAVARITPGSEETGGYQIWFGRQEADLAVFFIFWGTDTIEAGDYELFQGVPRDGVVVATVLENSDSIRSFAASEGTLTITQVGDTISGNFTMTLTDVTASENGEISVTGSFDNIPVSQ